MRGHDQGKLFNDLELHNYRLKDFKFSIIRLITYIFQANYGLFKKRILFFASLKED